MTEKIKEYASLLMPVPDIAVLIGMDDDELKAKIADKNTPEAKAYRLGRAETVLEIRRQEIALAKAGSPMAVELMQDYLVDQAQSEE
ncbi:MAG: hypothetical protein LBP72_01760 [Dysgonamonadaceae bacterium]|jgi:hypothetical protein|nr:hypothetical protein [Dysgonamonadaceae bacterium]